MKKKYKVYSAYYFIDDENPENSRKEEFQFQGETYACSEKQAINNVKFRTLGKISQYTPIAVSGHWANGIEWRAIKE